MEGDANIAEVENLITGSPFNSFVRTVPVHDDAVPPVLFTHVDNT
jgi:hypothetical protein